MADVWVETIQGLKATSCIRGLVGKGNVDWAQVQTYGSPNKPSPTVCIKSRDELGNKS